MEPPIIHGLMIALMCPSATAARAQDAAKALKLFKRCLAVRTLSRRRRECCFSWRISWYLAW